MARKRGTRAQQAYRVDLAIVLLSQSVPDSQIIALLVQKEKITEKQARRYLKHAQRIIAGLSNQGTSYERGLLIKQLDGLVYQLNQIKDYPSLIQTLKLKIDLQKLNFGGKGHDALLEGTSSSAELEAAIRALSDSGEA